MQPILRHPLLRHRWVWVWVAIAVLVLLTLFMAPNRNDEVGGSTYSRTPSGYGAWYAYLQRQGTPAQRWRKDLETFLKRPNGDRPVTMLQVGDNFNWSEEASSNRELLQQWLRRGNRLVLLGKRTDTTDAPFTTTHETPQGRVKIETIRRNTRPATQPTRPDLTTRAAWPSPPSPLSLGERENVRLPFSLEEKGLGDEGQSLALIQNLPVSSFPLAQAFQRITLLEDKFGDIIWQDSIGQGVSQGDRIVAVTPYLAANAYQSEAGNFAYLADLVQAKTNEVWINEYTHGHRDREELAEEGVFNPLDYLFKTPLLLLFTQTGIVLLIAVITLNRRFGPVQALSVPQPNNSEAYIQALAGVLQRAGCHSFTLKTLQKAERDRLKQQLGLGQAAADVAELARTWEAQTGRSAQELEALLQAYGQSQGDRISETQLVTWLKQWQQLRQD